MQLRGDINALCLNWISILSCTIQTDLSMLKQAQINGRISLICDTPVIAGLYPVRYALSALHILNIDEVERGGDK